MYVKENCFLTIVLFRKNGIVQEKQFNEGISKARN